MSLFAAKIIKNIANSKTTSIIFCRLCVFLQIRHRLMPFVRLILIFKFLLFSLKLVDEMYLDRRQYVLRALLKLLTHANFAHVVSLLKLLQIGYIHKEKIIDIIYFLCNIFIIKLSFGCNCFAIILPYLCGVESCGSAP